MSTPYSAADFERLLRDFQCTDAQPFTYRSLTMMAALRIAAAVMKPGVIERECEKPFEPAATCVSTTQLAAPHPQSPNGERQWLTIPAPKSMAKCENTQDSWRNGEKGQADDTGNDRATKPTLSAGASGGAEARHRRAGTA